MLTKRTPCFLITVFLFTMVAFLDNAKGQFHYKQAQVSDGGSVEGTIRFKGMTPSPVFVDLKSKLNSEFCIEHTPSNAKGQLIIQHVEIDGSGLKDVVVMLEDIDSGKTWSKEKLHIDFKNCQAQPKVGVIRKPVDSQDLGLLTVRNHDEGILHNPMGFSIGKNSRRIFFKKWLLNRGAEVDVTRSFRHLRKDLDTHFYIECEQHLWMSTSFHVVWNPYYDISRNNGTFKIDQIPPGTYRMKVWHPYAGQKLVSVNITAGETTRLDITLP